MVVGTSVHQNGAEAGGYPSNLSMDFRCLKAPALLKIADHYGLRLEPKLPQEELAVIVAKHFDSIRVVDEHAIMARFSRYINAQHRDPPDDDLKDDRNERKKRKRTTTRKGAEITNGRDAKRERSGIVAEDVLGEEEDDSATFCICHSRSYGDMVACDNKKCPDPTNWYHLPCVGLTKQVPEEWYCPECNRNQEEETEGKDTGNNRRGSATYVHMIETALKKSPRRQGSFRDICAFIEKEFHGQLNWKMESDVRKSQSSSRDVRKTPVWKSSVRKILLANGRFRRVPGGDRNLFELSS